MNRSHIREEYVNAHPRAKLSEAGARTFFVTPERSAAGAESKDPLRPKALRLRAARLRSG